MLASASLPTDLGGGRWWSAATSQLSEGATATLREGAKRRGEKDPLGEAFEIPPSNILEGVQRPDLTIPPPLGYQSITPASRTQQLNILERSAASGS